MTKPIFAIRTGQFADMNDTHLLGCPCKKSPDMIQYNTRKIFHFADISGIIRCNRRYQSMVNHKCRKQCKLVSDVPWLHKRHSRLLSCTIYHTFREEILPYLPTDIFTKFFSPDMGRPTKDIQSMLGLFIIQALFDLTDAEAIENYSFSDAYRYALDLPRDEYLAERTYYLYRSKLLGEGHEVFGTVLERIAERIKLQRRIQRKDSTLVRTWLKRISKIELFRATTKHFLVELKACHPIIFSRIPEKFREKFLPEKEGECWFAGDKPSQYGEVRFVSRPINHLESLITNDLLALPGNVKGWNC